MANAPRGLLFGTAGVPFSAENDSTLAGIERIKALGLDCQEIEFVQGVKMGLDMARKVRAKAAALGVRLASTPPTTSTSTPRIPASAWPARSGCSRGPGSGRPAARRAPSSTPRSTARTRPRRPTTP